MGDPLCVTVVVSAVGLAVWKIGVFAAVLILLALSAAAVGASTFRFVRRHIDRRTARWARDLREDARFDQLARTSSARSAQYVGLRSLVEDIERDAPVDADRLELQALLDHFVRLAASHQRFLDAMRLGGNLKPTNGEIPPSRRSDLVVRRIRCFDACRQRAEWLAAELDAIDELVRLVAQKLACPALDADVDGEIERRLWELDEVDLALDTALDQRAA